MLSFREPPTVIEGVTPSRDLREELRGGDALLAFSRGKDSWACALALHDAGVRVWPYFMHNVPDPDQEPGTPVRGLRFIEESLDECEQWFQREFGTHILRLIHPSFWRKLVHYVHQPPERCGVIDAAQIIVPDYPDLVTIAREVQGLPPDTWVCDGVRAADSPMRRIAMASHGPRNFVHHKFHAVWDWRKYHVTTAIKQAGIKLPIDYDWFGRSFDGIDHRFLGPLQEHAPDDYDRILAWFPQAPLILMRHQLTPALPPYPRKAA